MKFTWFVNLAVIGVFIFVLHSTGGDDFNRDVNMVAGEKVDNISSSNNLNYSNFNKSVSSYIDFERDWNRSKVERYVHKRVNQERTSRGLDKLYYKDSLVVIARYHSEDMANRSYFAHDSPQGERLGDRYSMFDISSCDWKGENIHKSYWRENVKGVGYVDNISMLADSVVNGWMGSRGHRKNILTEEFNSEAIGVYKTADDIVYVTQNFCG